ncbi:MAG: hypothetical protein MJ192_01095 [Clostridia bacterium]|nr:hypothetical protein [Clostridia bacterium]
MNASTDTGIRTRKIVSIVLFIVSICLLSLCIGFGVVGLAADAEIGRQAKIADIIYTDLVLDFGRMALAVFGGILLSYAMIRLKGTPFTAAAGKVLSVCFALIPAFFLFCR